MRLILEELKNGNVAFVKGYKKSDELWAELLSNIDELSVKELSSILSDNQLSFEHLIGARNLGKIAMGWSGFSHLYSCNATSGENQGKIEKLANAFAQSNCSIEVKQHARKAASEYTEKV
jgi:hypothetical protein